MGIAVLTTGKGAPSGAPGMTNKKSINGSNVRNCVQEASNQANLPRQYALLEHASEYHAVARMYIKQMGSNRHYKHTAGGGTAQHRPACPHSRYT